MVVRLADLKKQKAQTPIIAPTWVTSPTTRALYEACMTVFDQIRSDITSHKQLDINERRIIPRRLALRCGLSPSTVTPRRQLPLIEFINQLNIELGDLHVSSIAQKAKSGRTLTKKELEIENRELRAELKRLENVKLSSAAELMINSLVMDECKQHITTITKLREEIQQLHKVISGQAELNRKYIDESHS